MHPAKEGFSALPFFDEFDLSTVDILLISQYVEFPYPSYISEATGSAIKREPSCALHVYDENSIQPNLMHLFYSANSIFSYCEHYRTIYKTISCTLYILYRRLNLLS